MSSFILRKLMGGAVQVPRTRQLKKAFQNFLLTVVCGITTILVLKGSFGFESPSSVEDASENPAHSDNPSNYFVNHDRPLIKSANPQSHFLANLNRPLHNPNSITNHDRPLRKSQNPRSQITNHDRPLHKSQNPHSKIPYFHTNHDRPLRKSQNPHSQIPYFLTNHDQASVSESPLIRSELQHTRLLAEVNSLIESSDYPNPNPNQGAGSSNQSPDHIRASMAENPALIHEASESDEQGPQSQSATHYEPSILLVTGSQPLACDSTMGDYYLMKSLKNKMDYCRLHNLDIFYNMATLDPQMSGFWAKLPLLHTLMLAHPEKEWLWWVDSDAMITDMAFELPMERYKDYNLVLHGWKELVYDEKSWVGLNTGSFLIRNCEWSLNLIEAWAPMGPKGKAREEAGHLLSKALVGRPQFEADDQSALIYLLNEQKAKWASKVYLENTYYLHGYWLIIVDKYEEMIERYHPGLGDERWPFVTHFVGCKPCKKNKLALEDKCLKHMERAFNFADNQVMQFYGFQHEALNTHTLLRSTRVVP